MRWPDALRTSQAATTTIGAACIIRKVSVFARTTPVPCPTRITASVRSKSQGTYLASARCTSAPLLSAAPRFTGSPPAHLLSAEHPEIRGKVREETSAQLVRFISSLCGAFHGRSLTWDASAEDPTLRQPTRRDEEWEIRQVRHHDASCTPEPPASGKAMNEGSPLVIWNQCHLDDAPFEPSDHGQRQEVEHRDVSRSGGREGQRRHCEPCSPPDH